MDGSAGGLRQLVQATAGLCPSHFQGSCCGMKESNREYDTEETKEKKRRLESILLDISGFMFLRCT